MSPAPLLGSSEYAQVLCTEIWFAVSLAQRLQYLELRETRQNVGRVSCDGTEDGRQAVSLRSD